MPTDPQTPILPGTGASNDIHGIRAIALLEIAKGALAWLLAGMLAAAGPDALRHAMTRALSLLGRGIGDGLRTSLLDRITPDTVGIATAAIAAYGSLRLLEGWGCGGTAPGPRGWAASAPHSTCRSRSAHCGVRPTGSLSQCCWPTC